MMNSTKQVARAGFRGCKCCYRLPENKTTRTREKRQWKKDA